MPLYRKFVRHVLHPLSLWRSGDGAQLRYLREFERTQFLPPEQIRGLQFRRLRALLDHAWRHVPFYRHRFDAAGFHPNDFRRLEDLTALPPLEKRDVQDHREEMVAANWPEHDRILNETGGSTGAPVSFYLSHDRKRSRAAATWRHNRWAGWNIGDKTAVLWGASRDQPPPTWRARLRAALLERQLFLNTGHITEAGLAAYAEALRRYRPRVMLAYARSATLLARYLRTTGRSAPQLRSIVTSAEVLDDADRELLESTFGCPVHNRYGCREVSVVASECEQRQGLHTMAEGLYVEVVRGDRPAAPGEMGAILITDLLNYPMPLIRYRVGDLGAWAAEPCPCGRGRPRLQTVAGRVTDFLVGGDGRLVSGAFLTYYLVARRTSLGQVQIRQSAPGQVLFRIKPGAAFDPTADLAYLDQEVRRHLGEPARVEWEFVDELPNEPSGKFLFSRSTVTPGFLAGRSESSLRSRPEEVIQRCG
jgi:phenylacetate-CoA ligase